MNLSSCQIYRQNTSRGAAILELAFVLPILVLVVISGIEFSRGLQRMQIATALSREVASIAARECYYDIAGDPTQKALEEQALLSCLNGCALSIRNVAQRLAPGSEILVGVYAYDSTVAANQALDFHSAVLGQNSTKFAWKDASAGLVGGTIGSQVKLLTSRPPRGNIYVGEAYVPYRSIVNFVWSMLGQPPQVFYDVTVI